VNCTICSHDHASSFLHVKDYTVSNETFHLMRCDHCGYVYTDHPPTMQEIGRYYDSSDYISHTDSSKGIFNKVYQFVRNISVAQKFNLIGSYSNLKSGHLLDYGCGTGAFLKFAKQKKWTVMGMEPDEAARAKASGAIGSSVLSPSALNELIPKTFDAITLWHVLEHVHALHETLDAFKSILKENGILVIAVPNHTSWDAQHYQQFWAAYDVPRHLHHFTPQSMHQLLTEKGFFKIAMRPMWFDSFYVSMLSEKYKSGSINMVPAILNGIISNFFALFQPGKCSSQIYIYRQNTN